jgi:hypothetical protein
VGAAVVYASPASAQLAGSTVDVTARYSNASTIYSDPGSRIVSDGAVEYVSGSYANYNSSWQVDVFSDHITITDFLSAGLPFSDADFNGFVLDVLSGPAILTASVDASSTILPASVDVLGGDLFINFAGVGAQTGGTARINFTTAGMPAVPEPATWAMMLFGFGAVGVSMRRRRTALAHAA